MRTLMELLFITAQLPYPPRQGTTIRNYNIIRELAQRHTIDLITFLAPGEYLDAGTPLRQLCRRLHGVPQPMRSIRRRGFDTLTTRLPDMALRLESPAMREVVAEYAQTSTYDIVQNEGIETSQFGRLARMKAAEHGQNLRWVFDNHNCEYLLQKRNALTDLRMVRRWIAAGYSLAQWQKLVRYETAVCHDADATIAVSQADADALQLLVPHKTFTVVSNGVDLDEYRMTPCTETDSARSPRTLAFTGKMDYRPNIDAALWFGRNVMPLIVQRMPDICFQVVGMNPHPRSDELRNNPAIEITGEVPDTRPYIAAASVYVIPMRVGGGTRFKALEAMASGRPTVSTSLGVEGIAVENGCELYIADTPEEFAAKILRLLQDDDRTLAERRRLGLCARAFVEEHYGWSGIVPRMEAVYRRLMAVSAKVASSGEASNAE